MKPRTREQRFFIALLIWLVVVAIFAIGNTIIYSVKQEAGIGVGGAISLFVASFVSMIKLFFVLPAMWVVAVWQRVTGSDSVFRGAELGMTFYLLLTPYVVIPLVMRFLRGKQTP